MPALTILADDLTGACDTGAAFAGRGWHTRVAISLSASFADAEVWVISTESRALPEAEAAWAVEQAVRALGSLGSGLVYKKIDSTLRGSPGVELGALMRAQGIDRALVCPAFPEQGRTVQNGRVLVNGVPLEETPFAAGVRQPDLLRLFDVGPGSHLVTLAQVRRGADWLAGQLSHPGVWVADAEQGDDLQILAQAAAQAGLPLLCGSAGLARALVAGRPAQHPPEALPPRRGPVLVVAGSRHPAALAQVTALEKAGFQCTCLDERSLRSPLFHPQNALPLLTAVSRGQDAVLSTAGLAQQPGGDEQVAAALAQVAALVLDQARPGGIVLTGGATAVAICRALGCDAIDLGGEVSPGVVWGRLAGGRLAGLPVVTKAGGFGDEAALLEAAAFLH